ncbi:hypothetical protein [Rhodoferax aquaticus]|uniref:Uncharacterized protein n=1 Tax=Rhodoferax aquaticus TaxID=2527691 RepID=A0A515ERM0_9BURK|nr:hypothetical protein [Rhodoferax aquaticus]QDL55312.1 hypothetical protein EXZ61_14675 [Rhodoferax aquaticus]
MDISPSREREPGGTHGAAKPPRGLVGPISPPSDLLVFVRSQPFSKSAAAIGLARGQVHRIAHGYWPNDPRRILAAWEAYRGCTDAPGSSWFLRRVLPGGMVRHARTHYTSARLAFRIGTLVAVARVSGGDLLVQTLELSAERFVLNRVEVAE